MRVAAAICNLCGATRLEPLIDFGQQPIAHHFLRRSDEPEYTHPLVVCQCRRCGLVQIDDPVPPERLYSDYVCLSSWKAQPHAPGIVSQIRSLPGVSADSAILEIGSNDGSFLKLLRDAGFRRLLGVEPAHDARGAAEARGLDTISGYFGADAATDIVGAFGRADVLVSRQMLEHVPDLPDVLEGIRRAVKPGGYVVIEVPHFDLCLDTLDYSGVWEEHVNYFTSAVLGRALGAFGIDVLHRQTVTFSGEAQIVVAQVREVQGCAVAAFAACNIEEHRRAEAFAGLWPKFRQALIERVSATRELGREVVVYGAGCRACSLINFTGMGPLLSLVVDDQAEKTGLYMPGSHLAIRSSASLADMDPALCLLAVNAENEERVLARHQGLTARGHTFESVLPPSPRLMEVWRDVARTSSVS